MENLFAWNCAHRPLNKGIERGATSMSIFFNRVRILWEKYGTIYNALGDHLYTLLENMREISPVFFEGARAQYRILRDHEIEGQTVAITYYIYFSRDMNGIWKIDKY